MIKKIILLSISLVLLSSLAFSQEGRGNGRVTGKVLDAKGKPLSGVKIIMQSTKYNFKLETVSSEDGSFKIMGFSKSPFKFTFSKEGYTTIYSNVELSGINRNPKQEIVMRKPEPQDTKGQIDDASKANFKKANKLFKEKKYAEAEPLYKSFVQANPDIYKVKINYANTLMKLKKYPEAIAMYKEFLKGLKAEKGTLKGDTFAAQSYSSIGEAYMSQKKYDEAAANYITSMELVPPTDAAVAYNAAEIFFNTGKTDEAIKYYLVASKIKPKEAIYHSKIGYAYLNKGDLKKATEYFKKFLSMAPKDHPEYANIESLVASISQ